MTPIEALPSLTTKAETAVISGELITAENLKTRWGQDIVIMGTPGKTGVVVCSPNLNPLAVYRHPEWVLDHEGKTLGATPTLEQYDPWLWKSKSPEASRTQALNCLATLKKGGLPGLRFAAEIEGTVYDSSGNLAQASHPKHPELNTCTHERSTPPCDTVYQLSSCLSQEVVNFYCEYPQLLLQLSSVPQLGQLEDIVPNPHPYLHVASPKAAQLVSEIHSRSQAVLDPIAKRYGLTTPELFSAYQLRLWPNSALHVHAEAAIDPQTGEIDGAIELQRLNCLYTTAALIISLMDASTSHFLGESLPVRDVRHSLRRLLPTANNGRPYKTYSQELNPWIEEYISGRISSASRYPWDDQHGIARPRTEYGTVEFTNPGMHPNIGVNLGIASAVRLLSCIGIEAVAANPQSTLFDYAIKTYGPILSPIDSRDQLEIEQAFDLGGWNATVKLGNQSYKLSELAYQVAHLLLKVGSKYPSLHTDSLTAASYLVAACQPPSHDPLDYFDPESTSFSIGCLTDIKRSACSSSLWPLVLSEIKYTRIQAQLSVAKPELLVAPPNLLSLLSSSGLI